jgi:hypothetical protein
MKTKSVNQVVCNHAAACVKIVGDSCPCCKPHRLLSKCRNECGRFYGTKIRPMCVPVDKDTTALAGKDGIK